MDKCDPRRGVCVRYATRDEELDTVARDSHFVPSVGDLVSLAEFGCPHDGFPHNFGRVVERVFYHWRHKDDMSASCHTSTVLCIVEPATLVYGA